MFTFWFLNGIQVAKEGGAKWKSMTDKVSFIWFLYVFLLNISEIVERIIVWLFILFSRIMAMDNPIFIRRPRILIWKITHTPNYKKLEAIFSRDYVSLLLLHLFIYFKSWWFKWLWLWFCTCSMRRLGWWSLLRRSRSLLPVLYDRSKNDIS